MPQAILLFLAAICEFLHKQNIFRELMNRKTESMKEGDNPANEVEEKSTDDIVVEEIRMENRLADENDSSENSKEIRNEDIVKYDRQIRLFGLKTQRKLLSTIVQVFGTENFISAEVLKNLVLLGIEKIFVQRPILEFTKKIVPDDLNKINKNLIIECSDKMEDCQFRFIVDGMPLNGGSNIKEDESLSSQAQTCSYFICSKCLTLIYNGYKHECIRSGDKVLDVAHQCLAGAFAVQEYLKFVQGKSHADIFRIEF